MKNIVLTFCLTVLSFSLFAQVFVDPKATGASNGTSWNDAYTNLHVALANASVDEEVWVAADTLKLVGPDPSISFKITKNLSIYGGFQGELDKGLVDPLMKTVLMSDFSIQTQAEQAYHVLYVEAITSLTLEGIHIKNGIATGDLEEEKKGSAIYSLCSGLIMNNCIVSNNVTEKEGAVYLSGTSGLGEYTFRETLFNNNITQTNGVLRVASPSKYLNLIDTEFENNRTSTGSLVYADTTDVNIVNCLFDHNNRFVSGLVRVQSDSSTVMDVQNTSFLKNDSVSFLYNYKGNLKVDGCTFLENHVTNSGGLYTFGDSIVVTNNDFVNNRSNQALSVYGSANIMLFNNNTFSGDSSGSGYGVTYFYGTEAIFEDCSFSNMEYGNSQGAMLYLGGVDYITIKDCYFSNCSSSSSTLGYLTTDKKILIDHCTFIGNKANSQAATFYISSDDSLIIKDCLFDSNVTSNGNYGCYYAYAKNQIVKNCTFLKNSARYQAGAAYHYGDFLTIDSCQFIGNNSDDGGALAAFGGHVNITNTLFSNNGGDIIYSDGGAIYSSADSVSIDNCMFIGNTSTASGGALYLSTNLRLTNCFFEGNGDINNTRGGAIYFYPREGDNMIYGNVFSNNVSQQGGGIYMSGYAVQQTKAELVNNTFTNNRASKGMAIYNSQSETILINNLIPWGGDSSLFLDTVGAYVFNNNLIERNANSVLNDQPLFIDGRSDLSENSPAVDLGVSHPIHLEFVKDLFDNNRIQGNSIDIGAVESGFTQKSILIKGRVVYDPNQACQNSQNVIGVKGLVLTVSPGNAFAVTDNEGNYQFKLPVGDYTVALSLNEDQIELITPLCPGTGVVSGLLGNTHGQVVDAGNLFVDVDDCERIDVQVYTGRQRNCFTTTVRVLLENKGVLPVSGKTLSMAIPENVNVMGTTPFSVQQSNLLTFSNVQVDGLSTAVYLIEDSVSCDPTAANLGEELCFKSTLDVSDNCLDIPLSWDGSNTQLYAYCDGNDAVFNLFNTASSGMSERQDFQILLNDTLVYEGPYQLLAQDTLEVKVFDPKGELKLKAIQSEGHPIQEVVTVALPSCTGEGIVEGLDDVINSLAYGESMSCTHITGSYDPNDISVTPRGFGAEHSVLKGTTLTYTIRFQNTGSDTAFTVVVIDTIVPELDVSTLEIISSSHNVSTVVLDSVIRWTMNDILLPDSTTDLLGSQGFITFSLDLKGDVPFETEIKNKAGIYFDYNEPVITNEVFNTLKETYPKELGKVTVSEKVLSVENERSNVEIAYPNPVQKVLRLSRDMNYSLSNAKGELILKGKGEEINTEALPSGLYILDSELGVMKVVKQ